jgi:hypothetical protein
VRELKRFRVKPTLSPNDTLENLARRSARRFGAGRSHRRLAERALREFVSRSRCAHLLHNQVAMLWLKNLVKNLS